jgi:hypothetical protein
MTLGMQDTELDVNRAYSIVLVMGGGCSQPGNFPQEGHQVAKLEHANA